MSRIKGTYELKFGGETVVRWLDTATGHTYDSERGDQRMARGFVKQGDVWRADGYTFVPDAALAADWYVMRMVPDDVRGRPERVGGYPPIHTVFGPYTEAEARANAALRSEKSGGRDGRLGPKAYAVFQIQAGNTVVVQPPTPPTPVTIWS